MVGSGCGCGDKTSIGDAGAAARHACDSAPIAARHHREELRKRLRT